MAQFELFALIIISFLLLEFLFPRTKTNNSNNWLVNFGLYIIFMVCRPLAAPLIFLFSDIIDYQALELWGSLPFAFILLLSLILIDFFVYWQHRISHFFTLLWRLHLVHHSDTEMNVSTNFRHHPFEFFFASLISTIYLYLLKLPESAVIGYFFLSTIISLWHHSDIKLAPFLEKLFQPIFITPELHRLHHSSISTERNSNYGMVFSFWDRIFLTYTPAKNLKLGSEINFGLEYFRDNSDKTFINVLLQPKNYSNKKKSHPNKLKSNN